MNAVEQRFSIEKNHFLLFTTQTSTRIIIKGVSWTFHDRCPEVKTTNPWIDQLLVWVFSDNISVFIRYIKKNVVLGHLNCRCVYMMFRYNLPDDRFVNHNSLRSHRHRNIKLKTVCTYVQYSIILITLRITIMYCNDVGIRVLFSASSSVAHR